MSSGMTIKQSAHAQCDAFLSEKETVLKKALEQAREALQSEGKSTAGDKHETGRAMAHLEQEKLGKQWQEARRNRALFSQLDANQEMDVAGPGALVETQLGFFYLSVSAGKLAVQNPSGKPCFAVSMASPVGQNLAGLKAGEKMTFNGRTQEIISIH